jgi:hypothetical protein
MNDFLEPEDLAPFKRGRGKVVAMKPHQAKDGEKVVSRFRCWDGLLGCEQYRSKAEFRWHPLLCDACSLAITSRHNFEVRDIDYLAIFLAQDASLAKAAKVMGGSTDKIAAMQEGTPFHLPDLFRAINGVRKNAKNVEDTNRAYRMWFYDQAGADPVQSRKPAPGFAALPVGDR